MAKEALADLTGAAGPELDELYEQMEDIAGASQTLSDMGGNTKDAKGNLRPLVDILEELNLKTREMGLVSAPRFSSGYSARKPRRP